MSTIFNLANCFFPKFCILDLLIKKKKALVLYVTYYVLISYHEVGDFSLFSSSCTHTCLSFLPYSAVICHFLFSLPWHYNEYMFLLVFPGIWNSFSFHLINFWIYALVSKLTQNSKAPQSAKQPVSFVSLFFLNTFTFSKKESCSLLTGRGYKL